MPITPEQAALVDVAPQALPLPEPGVGDAGGADACGCEVCGSACRDEMWSRWA
jgi:hypothetical protein